MGNDQSRQIDDAVLRQQQSELKLAEGFQVVRLLPNGPAHGGGLLPYFDIITALDRHLLGQQVGDSNNISSSGGGGGSPAQFRFFKKYLFDRRGTPVCFTVYNIKLRGYRDVLLTPTDAWGGGGLLGCSVEWARADQAVQQCWHIVACLDGSPASFCTELQEERDYIIGMQQPEDQLVSMLKGEDDFYSRLAMWQELQRSALERRERFPSEVVFVPHSLLLLIYDQHENAVKEVVVEMGTRPGTPLGVGVASGLLHIIPAAAPVAVAAVATADSSSSSSSGGASGGGGGGGGAVSMAPDLASLPTMTRFYLPHDLNFPVDYPTTTATTTTAVSSAPPPPVAGTAAAEDPSASVTDAAHPQAENHQQQQQMQMQMQSAPGGAEGPSSNPFVNTADTAPGVFNPFAQGLGIKTVPPPPPPPSASVSQPAGAAAAVIPMPQQQQQQPAKHQPTMVESKKNTTTSSGSNSSSNTHAGAPVNVSPFGTGDSKSNGYHNRQPQPQPQPQQPVRYAFPDVPPPLAFPSFPRS